MDAPSQLENFLNSHRDDGQVLNEGTFTLAREKALEKLANFQLPFDGAWAVKVFQAAVSSGGGGPIRVDQTRSETRFYFPGRAEWTLDDIEEAFFNPEPDKDDALNYLKSALWSVGVGEKRAFQVALTGQTDTLVWDGEITHRIEAEESHNCLFLAVANLSGGSKLSNWISTESARKNAEVSRAMTERCFTSPVPLTIDGRRIDGLQFAPTHGWSKESFPLSITFKEAGLNSFPIPQGTFEDLGALQDDSLGKGSFMAVASKAMESMTRTSIASAAFLVTAHASACTTGKHHTWEPRPGPSICYWVRDGAVIDKEPFDIDPTCCSVGVILSAESLETDISGFHLGTGPEKQHRKRAIAFHASKHLMALNLVPLRELVSQSKKKSKIMGGVLMILGAGMTVASPFHGIACLGAGLYTAFSGGAEEEKLAQEYREALARLSAQWKLKYGQMPPINGSS